MKKKGVITFQSKGMEAWQTFMQGVIWMHENQILVMKLYNQKHGGMQWRRS